MKGFFQLDFPSVLVGVRGTGRDVLQAVRSTRRGSGVRQGILQALHAADEEQGLLTSVAQAGR